MTSLHGNLFHNDGPRETRNLRIVSSLNAQLDSS